MISKGTTHDNGGKLARYLVTGKDGELAELYELRGFASGNIVDAFRSVHVIAEATKAEQPFFHVQVRNPEGESLTREQWEYTADRIERILGLRDQPRAIAFHVEEETGERHMHVAWSRIDEETLTAKPLPFYKDRLKKVSRELELHFGLTLVPNWRADEIKYAPTRAEDEQARRLGLDPHEVRQTIRQCWERSDCGRTFETALAEQGMVLAAGDRRDFVVVDQAGGVHALGKRILDVSAAEVRKRMADLPHEQMASVEEARAFLQEQAVRKEQEKPVLAWDREHSEVAWQKAVVDAAIESAKAGPSPSPSPSNSKKRNQDQENIAAPVCNAAGILEQLTHHKATFTAGDVERAVGKQIADPFEHDLLTAEILGHVETIALSDHAAGPVTRYTTRAVLESERQVLIGAASLANTTQHGVTYHQAASTLDQYASLRHDQRAAFEHVTRPGGLALIDGPAGTGKSFALNAVRDAYEESGYRVIGLAPTNTAAQNLTIDGFQKATTIHSELYALDKQRTTWDSRTVLIVDEAAMVDTKILASLMTAAAKAGAKMIMVGDDRQLASIEHGGMFGVLKEQYGCATLTEITRQRKSEDKQASALMAQGNFPEALSIFAKIGAVNWSRSQDEARETLVRRWAADVAAAPEKSRFVFAYTNADVDKLNHQLREQQRQRGVLGRDQEFETSYGPRDFATGDRVQFTATDKKRGIMNGMAGSIEAIDGSEITVRLDGRQEKQVTFDAAEFQDFRHGYAGTIYKGQGRTLDQTYLYHSEHWRESSSYVALTRHRDKTELFVAVETARDLGQLAGQMGRTEDRRAASSYCEVERSNIRNRGMASPPISPAVRISTEAEDLRRRKPPRSTIPSRWVGGPQTGHMEEHQDWAREQARKYEERRRQEASAGMKPGSGERGASGKDEEIDRARFKTDPDYRRSKGGDRRTKATPAPRGPGGLPKPRPTMMPRRKPPILRENDGDRIGVHDANTGWHRSRPGHLASVGALARGIGSLFRQTMKVLTLKVAPTPKSGPRRRRSGETAKGFRRAARSALRQQTILHSTFPWLHIWVCSQRSECDDDLDNSLSIDDKRLAL
jgi:Ti-type conjugative transfer relaxase TraA